MTLNEDHLVAQSLAVLSRLFLSNAKDTAPAHAFPLPCHAPVPDSVEDAGSGGPWAAEAARRAFTRQLWGWVPHLAQMPRLPTLLT